MLFGLIIATPFLRNLASKYVTPPGEGAPPEQAQKEEVEYRGIATPDIPGSKTRAFCRAHHKGSNYFRKSFLFLRLG